MASICAYADIRSYKLESILNIVSSISKHRYFGSYRPALLLRVVKMKLLIFLLAFTGYCTCLQQQKNVLFFAIDDLRPELGAYGHDFIKSPHIDDLASKSILFERAYCQVAVCSPSRTSLLTGRRPDTNHVWRIAADEYWRTVPDATNATTIPQYFKENGYLTIGMGKIFHPGAPNGNDDDKYSWSPEGLPYVHTGENDSSRVKRQ